MTNNLFDLSGKVAIVTGACGLLGQSHCQALIEANAHVIGLDLDEAQLGQLKADLGERFNFFTGNVTDKSSLEGIRGKILESFGRIDILVNNAAINDMFENPALAAEQSQFEYYPLDMWKRSLDVNVTGVFLCAQVFGTPMAAQGSGSIINVASTYGVVGPDQSIYIDDEGMQSFYKSASYPTTKGAVINFTRFLAAYWGEKGVRVNTLSPGGVENGQDNWFIQNYSFKTALGRMANAKDYKGAIVFLASEASAYMTGANLIVDGGWTAM
ncbi:MAG: SDR family oxidoreductase [Bacteroidota bacterium]